MPDHFNISLPQVSVDCRDYFQTMYRKGCPLKDFLESEESIYVAWPHEKRLLPDTTDFERACEDIVKIRSICENCKNQQKTR